MYNGLHKFKYRSVPLNLLIMQKNVLEHKYLGRNKYLKI